MISVHHAMGVGYLENKTDHNIDLKSIDKGYFESGLIVDGILVSGFSHIGLGLFYRYGTYSATNWKNNLVPKVSVKFDFN